MTDRTLKILHKFFVVLSIFALSVGLYDFVKGNTETMKIGSFVTFIVLSYICKYYYVIVYWSKRIDIINTQERERQLRSGEMKEK